MLDYRIYTFLAVCRNMSFTKAADELSITQPAVSQHIKYLEDMYNTRLFSFNGKKMSITNEGRVLLNAATTMLHDSIHLRETLSAIKGEKKKLSFGATLTVGEYIVPYHMDKIIEKFGAEDINIKIANTNELLEDINSGSVDFALVEGYFEKSEYDYLTYSSEPYIAVAGVKLPEQSIEELLNYRIIVREEGSGTRAIFENVLSAHNLKVDDFAGKLEINNIGAIKSLVAKGTGISFIYKRAVEKELKDNSIFEIKIKDFSVNYNFTFVWRKNSIYADYYREVFELLRVKK